MDVKNEEGDFECDSGMDGKPVQLFQRRCDVVSWTETFLVCRCCATGALVD